MAGPLIHRSIPPPGVKTHLVIPGERFRVGPLHRWLYGDNYRDLWTLPITVPVLDLDSVGGGLTPLRTGGDGQSISLHFTGRDGIRYAVRSLDKDATRRVSPGIRNSVVGKVLQDMISALLPTGALVVDPLLEAAGVLHSKHTLVVIPDDPRLGEFRAGYAGLVGTLQLHPSEGPDDAPGFAGSRKVSGTENMLDDLEDSPCERVDARAFLKARFMDFLIGDGDRHPGQWRWARFPDGDCYTWLPVPEDRDQAFIYHGGVAMMLVRTMVPRAIRFRDPYPSVVGLTTNGWELDRELLAELERPAWEEVVDSLRARLVDGVIDDAVRRLPAPYYELVGEGLENALKARRDALPEFATRYYELISREVEIKATDEDEHASFEHLANGDLVVRMSRARDSGEEAEPPWFERTFRHEETGEVRVYLRGGDDRAEVSGAKGRITLRIDGGGGSDTFANASEAGAKRTFFYDARGDNVFVQGKGARIDERPYRRPPAATQPRRPSTARYALDWGGEAATYPTVWADPDLGVFARMVHGRTHFGYRRNPFASRHTVAVGLASRGYKPFASYEGTFRHAWADVDARLAVEYSGLKVTRFTGFGNDFHLENPPSFYKVRQGTFVLAPALEYRTGAEDWDDSEDEAEPRRSEFTVSLGPVVKWSNTPEDSKRGPFRRFAGSAAVRCGFLRPDRNPGRSRIRRTRQLRVRDAGVLRPGFRRRICRGMGCGIGIRKRGRRSAHIPDGAHPGQSHPGPAGGREENMGGLSLSRERLSGRARPGRSGPGGRPCAGFAQEPFRGRRLAVCECRTAAGRGGESTYWCPVSSACSELRMRGGCSTPPIRAMRMTGTTASGAGCGCPSWNAVRPSVLR